MPIKQSLLYKSAFFLLLNFLTILASQPITLDHKFNSAMPKTIKQQTADLPSFFEDNLNIYVFFGGLGFIVICSIIACLLCRLGKRARQERQGLLEKDQQD